MTTHSTDCPGCYGSDRHPNCNVSQPRGAGQGKSFADREAEAVQRTHDAAHQTHEDAVALGADCDDDSPALSANASFTERYKAERTKEMASLRAATRAIEARDAARVPEIRTLEEPDEVPDGFRAAREAGDEANYRGEPSDDPRYDPYGTPADGYRIALALRQVRAALAAPVVVAAAARPEPKMIYTNGIPDGYATAIAKMKENR